MQEYDENLEEIESIKQELRDYLGEIQQQFRDKTISYAHCKYRYELEIPEHLVRGARKPEDFEFTSKRSGFERFRTEAIKELVSKLEDSENQTKKQQAEFSRFLFHRFYEYHPIWNRLLQILSELDCLCSLSVVSFVSDGVMSRPILTNDRGVFIKFQEARHPCLSSAQNIIPNDIELGK